MCVRWGNSTSPDFLVGNGVKQGEIISLVLFNVYINDLFMHLNSSGIDGYLGTTYIMQIICVLSVCHLAGCSNSYIFAMNMQRNIN